MICQIVPPDSDKAVSLTHPRLLTADTHESRTGHSVGQDKIRYIERTTGDVR